MYLICQTENPENTSIEKQEIYQEIIIRKNNSIFDEDLLYSLFYENLQKKDFPKVLELMSKIGLKGYIEDNDREIILNIHGPQKIIWRSGKLEDPLDIGDSTNKKLSQIKVFEDIYKKMFGNSDSSTISNFLFSYFISFGKEAAFDLPTFWLYKSKCKFLEEQIPIKKIIFVAEKEIPFSNRQARKANFLVQETSIFLRLLSMFQETSNFVRNVQNIDLKLIKNLMKEMGFLNSKVIGKNTFFKRSFLGHPEEATIIYTLFLGDKFQFGKLILTSSSCDKNTIFKAEKILNRYLKILKTTNFTKECFDELLSGVEVYCTDIKKKTNPKLDFDLIVNIEPGIKNYQIGNIYFQNSKIKSDHIYRLAYHFGIVIGGLFNEKKIQSFQNTMENFVGTKINYNKQLNDSETIDLFFDLANKESVEKKAFNMELPGSGGAEFSFIKWRFFSIKEYPLFFQITPLLKVDKIMGVPWDLFFKAFHIVFRGKLGFVTKNQSMIDLEAGLPINIVDAFSFKFKPSELLKPEASFGIKKDYENFEISGRINGSYKSDSSILERFLRSNKKYNNKNLKDEKKDFFLDLSGKIDYKIVRNRFISSLLSLNPSLSFLRFCALGGSISLESKNGICLEENKLFCNLDLKGIFPLNGRSFSIFETSNHDILDKRDSIIKSLLSLRFIYLREIENSARLISIPKMFSINLGIFFCLSWQKKLDDYIRWNFVNEYIFSCGGILSLEFLTMAYIYLTFGFIYSHLDNGKLTFKIGIINNLASFM